MDDNFFNLKNSHKQNKNTFPLIKHSKNSLSGNMKIITANMKLTSNKFKIQIVYIFIVLNNLKWNKTHNKHLKLHRVLGLI